MAPPVTFPATLRSTVSPAVTAALIYGAGNLVGTKLTFTDMARGGGGGGVIQSVTLRDKAGQGGTYDLFLFDQDPTGTTFTDRAAVALVAADLAKCIGVVTLAAVKLAAAATMGVSTQNNLNLAYKLASGTTIYGALVARGTPTFASTSDISLDLVSQPD